MRRFTALYPALDPVPVYRFEGVLLCSLTSVYAAAARYGRPTRLHIAIARVKKNISDAIPNLFDDGNRDKVDSIESILSGNC